MKLFPQCMQCLFLILYEHSKLSYAYSWMHYEFIRYAIESKKFTCADVGFTGDEAKRILNFKPVFSIKSFQLFDFTASLNFLGNLGFAHIGHSPLP